MKYEIIEGTDGSTTIIISGELDALTVPEIRKAFREIEEAASGDVILDLTELELLDASGNGAINALFRRVKERGRKFEVVGVQGQPLQIFQVLRLDQVFPITPKPSE